jgi:hypothetical protein
VRTRAGPPGRRPAAGRAATSGTLGGGFRLRLGLGLALALLAAACSPGSDGPGGSTGSGDDVDLVRDADALAGAIEEIAAAVGDGPIRYRDVIVYPTYAIVEAQDPEAPDHIDRYTWRDGDVGDPEPVHLSGPQEEVDLELFPASAVRWSDLAGMAAEAEDRLEAAEPVPIEEPAASYVSVGRSSADDRPLTVSVYVNGPRRSGYVELSPEGEVLQTYVS